MCESVSALARVCVCVRVCVWVGARARACARCGSVRVCMYVFGAEWRVG